MFPPPPPRTPFPRMGVQSQRISQVRVQGLPLETLLHQSAVEIAPVLNQSIIETGPMSVIDLARAEAILRQTG
jgi:hypothetical protein